MTHQVETISENALYTYSLVSYSRAAWLTWPVHVRPVCMATTMTVAVVFVALCTADLKLPDLYGLTQQSTGHNCPYLFRVRSSGPEESLD